MEILHAVFELLPPSDIANVRLTCKLLLNVAGVQYLLPEVHLIYTEESYQRLVDTALDQNFSRYVTSLFIEGDTLVPISKRDWETAIQPEGSQGPNDNHRVSSASSSYDRMLFLWRNTVNECVGGRHRISDDALAIAYEKHTENFMVQQNFFRRDHIRGLTYVLRHFPRITTISLSFLNGIGPRARALNEAFSSGIFPAIGHNLIVNTDNTASITDILNAALLAGLVLKDLHCGYVDLLHWIYHMHERKQLNVIKPILENLRTLTLLFSIGSVWDEDGSLEYDSRISLEILNRKFYIYDFIRAARNLLELKLHFLWEDPCPADLFHVVGSFTWSLLKEVDFACIETKEEVFIKFFQRHASTLRHLALDRIRVTQGSWSSALPKLRELLTLDSVRLSGHISSNEPFEYWYLEVSLDNRLEGSRTRAALEHYMMHGGACPLHDRDSFPMTWIGDRT